MDRAQKQTEVAQLADSYKKAAAIFLVHYCGLTVAEITEIRRELHKVDAQLKVVKNRLMLRALADQEEVSDLVEYLKGPTAITFVNEDPVGAAKILTKYEGRFEPLQVHGAVVRGQVLNAKEVDALAKLPSKEELYAKLLGTLMAPASNLVRVLHAVPTKVAQVMAAIRDTKE